MKSNIYSLRDKDKFLHMTAEEIDNINQSGMELMWEAMVSGNADLHIHSNASDGKDSPAQIVHEILRKDLDSFALTDHDTFEGFKVISTLYDKLNQLGLNLPDFIPGIELNSQFEGEDLHILAYFPLGSYYLLEEYLTHRIEAREKRNRTIIDKAKSLGMNLEYNDLLSMGGGTIGRVHVAALLMNKGYADSNKEAFETFLEEGCPLYIPKNLPDLKYTLKSIRNAGGIPVLAHPTRYKMWPTEDNVDAKQVYLSKLELMKEWGLQGIEVLHTEMTLAESRDLAFMGRKLGLIPTSGSDYHGSHRPHVHIRNKNEDPRKFLSLFYEQFRINR